MHKMYRSINVLIFDFYSTTRYIPFRSFYQYQVFWQQIRCIVG